MPSLKVLSLVVDLLTAGESKILTDKMRLNISFAYSYEVGVDILHGSQRRSWKPELTAGKV